jgi:hypothetical protein
MNFIFLTFNIAYQKQYKYPTHKYGCLLKILFRKCTFACVFFKKTNFYDSLTTFYLIDSVFTPYNLSIVSSKAWWSPSQIAKLSNCKICLTQWKLITNIFCKNQNSRSNEKGSNVKIDKVENFKDPLNQCTSQTNLETRERHINNKKLLKLLKQIHKLRIYPNLRSKSSL